MWAKVLNPMVCVFLLGRKIFRILLWTGKIKTKQKILLRAVAQRELHSRSPTTLSSTVTQHFKQDIKYSI